MSYEIEHLLNKLIIRDTEKYGRVRSLKQIDQHPMFEIIPGDIESWENNLKRHSKRYKFSHYSFTECNQL